MNKNIPESEISCYHGMLKYLAELENTTLTKFIELKAIPENFKKTPYKRSMTKVYKNGIEYGCPTKQHIKGGLLMYITPEKQAFPLDTVWDKIVVEVYKGIKDFKTEIKSAGNYNDSLGGGWSQNVSMYKINDRYFAMMDCACR